MPQHIEHGKTQFVVVIIRIRIDKINRGMLLRLSKPATFSRISPNKGSRIKRFEKGEKMLPSKLM